jgi:hypothetical protein
MSPRAARALRRSLSSLAVAAYLAAAAMPCPPTASAIARAEAASTNGTSSHAAHHGHGDRAEAVDASHTHSAAMIAAPCHCGCGKRAGAVPSSRLGPVLLAESIVFAAACTIAPAISPVDDASSLALAPPTPVPLSRFA